MLTPCFVTAVPDFSGVTHRGFPFGMKNYRAAV
jgi:hypothetical protein